MPFPPLNLGIYDSNRPMTNIVGIKLNRSICVESQPVVFALLMPEMPTLATAPTTTRPTTAYTTLLIFNFYQLLSSCHLL